jgi:RecJ-like exonuclease
VSRGVTPRFAQGRSAALRAEPATPSRAKPAAANAMRFTWRTSTCPDCGDGKVTIADCHGFTDVRCDTCDGTAEIDCVCAECGCGLPLNEEGLCEKCEDASTLPVAAFDEKYRARIEEKPLGKGWHRIAA